MFLLFSLWNQLKRKFLRRPLRLACSLAAAAALLLPGLQADAAALYGGDAPGKSSAQRQETDGGAASFLNDGKAAPVTLRRVYLCGEETQPLGQLPPEEVHRMLLEQPRLTATVEGAAVVLTEQINDLSDNCRRSATFGVDSGGSLTLFEGPPKEEKVMKTFYQLDLQHMESALPKEELQRLISGIRVQDKDEFNSVLSSFGDYAVGASRGTMQHTY
ncbi:BofC C-terminal domain-containing protein [Paenibacillus pasadenensis]|uniref:BofC C-terminal domain-containing protein n=1 Tax=Paenibacillus pasadenensis TaxID=217090 RepID=UPI00203E012C|nr:BofC C-terminal domain-containing protein [Paenibacillus pasadenensis]MCM3746694.1 BofC C-terminal domain-containing protein [Paenibacillus pasadenensis]